jgi:hypothetical protein
MTTIAVTPIGRQQDATYEVIRLRVYVTEPEIFELYDRMEVWKSPRDLPSGPYEELTAESIKPALIPKDAADAPATPVAGPNAVLDGKDLQLRANETDDVVITFAGADPISFGDAATQVQAQGLGQVTAYVQNDGSFVVASLASGIFASLRVVGGEAAPLLGLPTEEPDALSFGKNARRHISSGISFYDFIDPWGSSAYNYKIRFRNAHTGAVSEFSQRFPGTKRLGLDPGDLAIGRVLLVQTDGKPLINQQVRVHLEFDGQEIDGRHLAGGDIVELTDATGLVEFTLPRGQRVSVLISGTKSVRTITVPDQDVFNLLDPAIADEDVFRVQVPEIVVAERRSL